MEIGIDLTGLWRPATGVYVYAIELARTLITLDQTNRYTLFFTGKVHSEFQELDAKFRAVLIPVKDEIISKQIVLAALCNTLALDLIHFPAFPAPLVCFRPFIWTLHDATAWLHPETMSWKGRLYFRHLGRHTANSSKALVTVSNESKRNIVDALRLPESKVRVIYEGIGGTFRRICDPTILNSVRLRYALPEHFLLTVGTLEPRKNLPFLIRAFQRFREISGSRVGLVIVGRKGWRTEAIDKSVHNVESSVVLTGYVPREDLVALYSLADAFVLASVYEGFGFPALEAMACGCPVIVSNRGSLPEVVGNAAVLINPEDVESLVEALRRVFHDPGSARVLVEKGLARAKEFSWRTTASKTLDLYREVVDGKELRTTSVSLA